MFRKIGYIIISVLLMMFAMINSVSVFAQDELYQTTAGQLIITVHLDSTVLEINSKSLLIRLNYETGKIALKQEISALTSDNDTIQAKFNSLENTFIRFDGQLGLEYINTEGHPPLDFVVEGTISPGNKDVMGNGNLVHLIHGTSNACILSLTFTLGIDELFPENKMSGLGNEIHIQVIQSVLGRSND